MTFLIEPGVALAPANSKSDRAGSKTPQAGSGDAFARSLEEDRSAEGKGSDASHPAKGETANAGQGPSPFSPLQTGEADTAANADTSPDAGELLHSDEEAAATADSNEADELLVQGKEAAANPVEVADDDEDSGDTEMALASLAVTTEDGSPKPADADISASTPAQPVSTEHPEASKDARPADAPPPPEAQTMAVQAAAGSDTRQTAIRTTDKDTRLSSPLIGKATPIGKATAAPAADDVEATSLQSAAKPEGKSENVSSGKTVTPEGGDAFMAELADASEDTNANSGKTGTTASPSPAPDPSTQMVATVPGAMPATQSAAKPAQSQIQMASTNAIVTASPAETVKIITDAVSSPDDTPDRITVQLDPPELGRVSIDFKFDAHGLQHITVTGESPEALRQLRLMHFELTQALERNGLSSQNMTFQQQQSGHQQSQTPASGRLFENSGPTADSSLLTTANITADTIRPARTASGGLDIRL